MNGRAAPRDCEQAGASQAQTDVRADLPWNETAALGAPAARGPRSWAAAGPLRDCEQWHGNRNSLCANC